MQRIIYEWSHNRGPWQTWMQTFEDWSSLRMIRGCCVAYHAKLHKSAQPDLDTNQQWLTALCNQYNFHVDPRVLQLLNAICAIETMKLHGIVLTNALHGNLRSLAKCQQKPDQLQAVAAGHLAAYCFVRREYEEANWVSERLLRYQDELATPQFAFCVELDNNPDLRHDLRFLPFDITEKKEEKITEALSVHLPPVIICAYITLLCADEEERESRLQRLLSLCRTVMNVNLDNRSKYWTKKMLAWVSAKPYS